MAVPRTYIRAIPASLPAGQVLVHGALHRWRADDGHVYGRFRLWLQPYDRARLTECECGLARAHYTSRPEIGHRTGPREALRTTLPPLPSLGC